MVFAIKKSSNPPFLEFKRIKWSLNFDLSSFSEIHSKAKAVSIPDNIRQMFFNDV